MDFIYYLCFGEFPVPLPQRRPQYIDRTQGKWWEKALAEFSQRCSPARRLALARCHASLLLPEPLVTQPARMPLENEANTAPDGLHSDADKPKWAPSLINTIMTKRDKVLMAKCGLQQLRPEDYTSFDDLLKVNARGVFAWSAPRIRRGNGRNCDRIFVDTETHINLWRLFDRW